jgi:hypothetical protein
MHSAKLVRAELVRDSSGNQEVRADLFNILVSQSDLILNVVFDGLVFLTELVEEGGDPFWPM